MWWFSYRQDESVNSLTMVNLTTANSGTYVCSAMNSAGSASQATSLTVLGMYFQSLIDYRLVCVCQWVVMDGES